MLAEAAALVRTNASLQGFSRAFGRAARDGGVIEHASVVGSVAPAIPFRSIFNSVAYLDASDLPRVLPMLTREYESSGITAWAVWAHESDRAASAALAQAGLRIDSHPMAMYAELERLKLGADDRREASIAEDLEEFDGVLAGAYNFPPGVLVYCFPCLLEEFRGYVLRDAGKAICALATVEVAGDCAVTLVGTVPEARGEGAASQLMCFALARARDRGCRSTTLQATAMGESLYARLGYRGFGPMNLWEHRTAPDPTRS